MSEFATCNKCNKSYEKTKANFYTDRGKIVASICKTCKKKNVKKYNKLTYDKEVKKLEMRKYRERKKLKELEAMEKLKQNLRETLQRLKESGYPTL